MENCTDQMKKTVMIVDDELFFRELLGDILKKEGFIIVAEATDGIEAVDKYRKHRPGLTVMDIFMPEGNGIEAVKEILSFDQYAKVVICSGVGYDDDIDAARSAGASDVIYKPFMATEVVDIVNRVMGTTDAQ
jgi:two-component system chemotaxis response regulator CheY